MTYRITFAAIAAAIVFAIIGSPRGSESATAGLAESPPTAAAVYTVDMAHSTLIFRIRHFGVAYFFGRVNKPSGEFWIDDNDLTNSFVNITLEMKEMDAGNDSRDRFLMGPDFFNVREHPQATFKSASISKISDSTYEATGDFTMRGVTKRITVPVAEFTTKTLERFGQRAGFLCTFTIKRSEYGMDKLVQEGTLGDEVQITASIEGVVQP